MAKRKYFQVLVNGKVFSNRLTEAQADIDCLHYRNNCADDSYWVEKYGYGIAYVEAE